MQLYAALALYMLLSVAFEYKYFTLFLYVLLTHNNPTNRVIRKGLFSLLAFKAKLRPQCIGS